MSTWRHTPRRRTTYVVSCWASTWGCNPRRGRRSGRRRRGRHGVIVITAAVFAVRTVVFAVRTVVAAPILFAAATGNSSGSGSRNAPSSQDSVAHGVTRWIRGNAATWSQSRVHQSRHRDRMGTIGSLAVDLLHTLTTTWDKPVLEASQRITHTQPHTTATHTPRRVCRTAQSVWQCAPRARRPVTSRSGRPTKGRRVTGHVLQETSHIGTTPGEHTTRLSLPRWAT